MADAVKIRDVLRVCRPAPGDRQALYKYLRWDWEHLTDEEKGKLPKIGALRALAAIKTFGPEAIALAKEAHATWEVMISQYGNKAEVWDALDLPFMAGLRNLRNLLQAGSKVALPKFLAQLQDEKAVRRSKQLPFRFLSAYREVESAGGMNSRVMQALSQAMQLSVANLPKLEGVTAVAADNSGSMAHKLSAKSAVSYADIANVFTALAGHLSDQGYSMAFGTDVASVSVNPADSILTNAQKVARADTKGMSTNGFLIPVHLMGGTVHWTQSSYHSGYGFKKGHIVKTLSPIKVDRVLIFTDCQLYDASGENESLAQQMAVYRRTINPNARLYVFNLAGYGTMQTPKDDPLSVEVAGWSEQVLRFIPLFEKGAEVGVNLIDRMTQAGVVSESEDL